MKKTTIRDFSKKKRQGKKLVLVTCYDYTFAKIIEDSGGIDGVLVGDSLGMVIKGENDTLNVEVEEVIYHTRAVRKGLERPLLIADMPFGSYQKNISQGTENAIKLIKAGADAIKIEGGSEVIPLIDNLTSHGIPVMGHVGMTPQYKNLFGGYRILGREKKEEEKIKENALEIEKAGAFAVVLEMVPQKLGKEVTKMLNIPVIGIGAGKFTDGQILVLYDFLGLFKDLNIRFVKEYAKGYETFKNAIKTFSDEVKKGIYPGNEHVYD